MKQILKKVLACVLAGTMLASTMVLTAQADSTPPSTQQILANGSTVSAENGKVTVKKTITGTDTENKFDITLTVTTQEEISKLDISPDAAVVLVMDTSNSMKWDIDGNSTSDVNSQRITLAKAAAQDFLSSYVKDAADAKRMVSVVEFGANAQTVLQWTDANVGTNQVSSAVSAALNEVQVGFTFTVASTEDDWKWNGSRRGGQYECSVCKEKGPAYSSNPGKNSTSCPSHMHDISDGGGTNIEGGLTLARNLLTSGAAQGGDIEGIKNVYVVLLTDGQPTYHVDGEDGADISTTETAFLNGARGGGNYTTWDDCKDVPGIAASIKNTATLYSISFATSTSALIPKEDGGENELTIKGWLGGFSHRNFDATNDENLTLSFENISLIIKNAAKAWMTTDPMGQNIVFDQKYNQDQNNVAVDPSSSTVKSFDTEKNTLTWDLKNDVFSKKTVGNVTTYTYTMKYRIQLDTAAGSAAAFTHCPTNGTTTLSYMVTDENGNINPELKYVNYTVPAVKGLFGDLSFTKTSYYAPNAPLAGAQFTITRDDGRVTRTATSGANGGVHFANLPNGTYTLTETQAAPGYDKTSAATHTVTVSFGTVQVDGKTAPLNVTNKLQQKNDVTVSGTKTWVAPAGTVHPTITIELWRDGTKVDETTLANGTTDYQFEKLARYDLETGKEYVYTVKERDVNGYTSAQDGVHFTNTIKQEKTAVSGTKTWVDPVGTTHPAITIELLRDGTKVDSTTLANGVTTYSFDQLDKYNLTDGHAYVYTVREQPVDGYTSVQSGTSFTNTIEQEKTAVSGTKTWLDPVGTTHPAITIELLRDGTKLDSVTLANGTTAYSFENLDKYDLTDGHAYVYTVQEKSVDGYTSSQTGSDFTNTIEQEKTAVSGTKTWVAPAGTVHPTITIELLRDGVKLDATTLENGTTTYSFDNLDRYDLSTGKAYVYTVRELPVDGYTTVQDGTSFTNTIKQDATVSVSGTKTWIAPAGTVHPTVTMELWRDGAKVDAKTLENGTTTYVFDKLDKYDLTDGHAYVYTVREQPVEGYTSRQDGTNFTNTINQKKLAVSGTKTWIAPAGTVHPAITIELWRDGTKLDAVTLENGTTTYSFDDLDKYDLTDGHAYVYTVREQPVEGYTSVQTGTDFTNTIEQEKTAVSGTKTWIAPAGTVHPTITIELLRDGTKLDAVTLENGTTTYSFENLDQYDLTDGHAYVYTVREQPVNGYTSKQDGTNFTNTIEQDATVSVSGTKTWIAPVGTVHPAITIELLRDGVKLDAVTLENGTTTYSFDNLDRYDLSTGKAYVYTVREQPVEGYTSVQDGTNFTNTIAQDATVSVSGTKTWIAPVGTVHPTITIELLRDGVKLDATTLENGTTTYSFENLDQYDLTDGHAYVYTVREQPVNGYTSVQDGTNFTNTINQKKLAISGTKTWMDPAGTVHPAITIELLRDGTRFDARTLENGTTTYSFENLDQYDLTDGHAYVYTVREQSVDGYTSVQDGTNFTNTIEQEKTAVSGTKTWVAPAGTVHPTITIELLRDGAKVDSVTLENGTTTYSFDDLDQYDLTDGHAYVYTVRELPVEGYTSVQDGTNFTNTIAQNGTVSVSGTKTWIAPAGTVHPTITIELLRDGVKVDSKTLANGTTTYSFENLDQYDLTDGHAYVYTMREQPVDGYTSVQDGTNFTNTIAQDATVSVSGTKTWIAPAGTVHPTITIELLRDGAKVDSTTLENGTTTYAFDNLDQYDLTDGHAYVYTVREQSVEGYTSKQDGTNFTNTIAQDATVSVSGTKTWIAPAGTVHPTITIELLRDGTVMDSVQLPYGTTEYRFTGLDRYDLTTGKEYAYTVRELPVEGYTSVQDGTNFTNTYVEEEDIPDENPPLDGPASSQPEEDIPDENPPLDGSTSSQPEEDIPDDSVPLTGGAFPTGEMAVVLIVSALAASVLFYRRKKNREV